MKTNSKTTSVDHAYAEIRGWVGPIGAAGTGLISVAGGGTETGAAASMRFIGAKVTDAGGTAVVEIFGAEISPTALSGNTNDWAPVDATDVTLGLATASVVRIASGGAYDLTGLVAPGDGEDRWILLANISAYTITLKHDATSTAANRFYCPGDVDFALAQDASVLLWYDTTSARWRVIGATSSSSGGGITVGTVTPDGSPFAVTTGTTYKAFPGAGWLTNPTATEHGVGDTFLICYRDGTDHLTAGNIVAKIATVTSTSPWTYTVGGQFTIEDVTNDLRPQGDQVSVLDIGDGTYHAVITADEYDGTKNLLLHVLICDDASDVMSSGSTWTRHEVAQPAGHTTDAVNGRVHLLSSGDYMMAAQYVTGGVSHTVVLSTSDITDWSSPTMVELATGYNEMDFEELPDTTLRAHLRDAAGTDHWATESTDFGATWSAPTLLYAAVDYPAWRRLPSGVGLTVYQTTGASSDTAWRQTATADTDTGWGAETILDSAGDNGEYATILQLDNNHVLVVYGRQNGSTESNIFSQVFTDSTVFATSGTVRVSEADTTPDFLEDKLVAGANITITKLGTGGDESLEIASSAGSGTAGTPALTLGETNSAGVASTFVATDAAIAIFNPALPTTEAFGDAAATGSSPYAARLDHLHGMPTASGGTGELLISDSPSTPLIFADLIQNEAQNDLVYADL